jgi:hypothetical protein
VLAICTLAFAVVRHSPRLLQPLAAELTNEARWRRRARALHSLAEMTSNQTEQREREQAPTSAGPQTQEPLRSPMKFFVWIVILFAGVVALGMMDP